MSVLKLEHVHKSFKDLVAVNDLSFELPSGVIFGLLGPNGAGKTTTIRMIMGIIIPDKGFVTILDQPNSQMMRDKVGYLPEERGLYRKMKVKELLTFMAELKGMKHSHALKKIDYWLERFDLKDWENKKAEELSRGMQQKVQFIATIVHEPQLIILDEPFTGLDPVNAELLKNVIMEQKERGATIIFSTHLMEQVEKVCDSICLINEGKSVLMGNLKEIKKNFRSNTAIMEFEGEAKFLHDKSLVEKFALNDHVAEIYPAQGKSIQDVLKQAIREVSIQKFEVKEPSLHEIFIETVTQGKKK